MSATIIRDERTGIYYVENLGPSKISDAFNNKINDFHFNKPANERILDFKHINCTEEERDEAINYYYNIIKVDLKEIDNKSNICLTCVPSHNAGAISYSLKQIVHRLSLEFGFIDAASCLERTYTIQKLAGGNSDRTIETHLDSISLNNISLIKNRSVLILDDVLTSGNSLLACKQLLEGAGAARVFCLALSKINRH